MRRAQRIAFVLFTILESCCVASAADMPMKAPPYVAPFSWTGFYIGGHIGTVWAQALVALHAAQGLEKQGLLDTMQGHILAQAELLGTYQR